MLSATEALTIAVKAQQITPRELLEKRIEESAARGDEFMYFGLPIDAETRQELTEKGYRIREKEFLSKVIWGSEKK